VPQAAKESRRNALLASTAAFTSPLRVSVPLWFKACPRAALRADPGAAEHGLTVSTPAGHGLHRSFSPLARRTLPTPAAPSASRPAPAARSSRARRLAAA
jgi:hypothetical protein